MHFSADCDILNIEKWTPRIPEGGNNANKIKEDVLPSAIKIAVVGSKGPWSTSFNSYLYHNLEEMSIL